MHELVVVEHGEEQIPLTSLFFDDDFTNYEEYLQLFLEEKPLTIKYIISRLSKIIIDLSKESNLDIKNHTISLVRNFFKAILIVYADSQHKKWGNMNWVDLTATSLNALEDTCNTIKKTNKQPLIPTHDVTSLNEFALEFANNPRVLGLIQIYTEQLLNDAFIHDESYEPGKTAKDSQKFYSFLAETLYNNASETTGDTEKQLQLIISTITWLVDSGLIPEDYRYMDAGCGNGERILLPTLKELQAKGIQPKKVIAADLNPPEKNEFWDPIELDFANSSFADSMLVDHLDNKKLNLISLIWSPINDLHIREQLSAIRNFVQLLDDEGILLLEVPTGYQEEVNLHFTQQYPTENQQPFGTIEVAFTGENQKEISKDFMINPLKDYILFQQLTGLKLLNNTEDFPESIDTLYTTQGGKERAFLVFQKVGEQKESLAEMLDSNI